VGVRALANVWLEAPPVIGAGAVADEVLIAEKASDGRPDRPTPPPPEG
jgi:hypothetical protein